MIEPEEDVALTLVHTADWHLGKPFPGFSKPAREKLMRARLSVLDRIFALAEAERADAVLCAGDLFDGPKPEPEWWQGLADKLRGTPASRPIFLLPGNHDALLPGSVWDPAYGFLARLPAHAHLIDRPGFSFPLKEGARLYASPCLSQSGAEDQALALPAREPGDGSIRVGMVHGSTFEMPDWQANFPIAKDAAERRGFDYLAIGDTHSFRAIPEGSTRNLTVYPSAPEPTNFGERDSGHVAVVFIKRSRTVRVIPRDVAYWSWERHDIESFEKLKSLVARADLAKRVLKVRLDMKLPAPEYEEALRLLEQLQGTTAVQPKAGIAEVDRSGLELDTRDIEQLFDEMPDGIREAVRLLKADEEGPQARAAQRALYHLYALVRRVA